MKSGRIGRAIVIATVLGISLDPTAAQKTIFNPRIVVDAQYTDNVEYASDPEQRNSDTSTRLTVNLPVVRQWKTGQFELNYTPGFEKFGDFGRLDNDSHRLRFNLRSKPSRTRELDLRASFTRTQDQAATDSLDSAELFLAPITTRALGRADLKFSAPMGSGTWSWTGNLGLSDSRFKTIDQSGSTISDLGIENRTQYRAGASFNRQLSRVTSLGFGYDIQVNELDASGDDMTHSVSLNTTRQVGPKTRISASLGGFLRDLDQPLTLNGEDSETGFQATFRTTREYKNARLQLSLNHRPSSGGVRIGTSTNTALGLNLNGDVAERWNWRSAARYSRRDPTDSTLSTLDTVSLRGSIERGFSALLAASLGAEFTDQSDESDYYTLNLGLVFYPLGRSQIAR